MEFEEVLQKKPKTCGNNFFWIPLNMPLYLQN